MRQKAGWVRQGLLKRKVAQADVCKVRKMLFVVECEYISENSRDRLYLSQVQEIRNPAARLFQKKAAVVAAKLVLSAALTVPAASCAVVAAYLERGYMAYGGEYLFILMVFRAVYWALGKFLPDEKWRIQKCKTYLFRMLCKTGIAITLRFRSWRHSRSTRFIR